ncbi:hypothetical protein ACWEOI_29330 [Nocardia sp. NPDC004340]
MAFGFHVTPYPKGYIGYPHFYADDDTFVIGVRLHAQVAYDHLSGALAPG